MQSIIHSLTFIVLVYITYSSYVFEVNKAAISFAVPLYEKNRNEQIYSRPNNQNDSGKVGSEFLDPQLYNVGRASQPLTEHVHSATLTELSNGQIMAVWYAGSREGAKDVALHYALLPKVKPKALNDNDELRREWGPSKVLLTVAEIEADLGRYIKKIGNPVLYADHKGRLHLFYVSVSLGGWAGSAINHQYSDDEGESWSRSKRLVTSPFINISTLVKSPPFEYSDGTLGLPVYHEFLGKFSEILHLNHQYDVVAKTRIDSGRSTIQPLVLSVDTSLADVYMRSVNSDVRYVKKTQLHINKAGMASRLWRNEPLLVGDVGRLPLPNSDAAVAGINTDAAHLLVFNNSKTKRDVLSLAVQQQANNREEWPIVYDFERAATNEEGRYSYPYMLRASDGVYHLLYSWNREHIKHVQFNQTWLEEITP